LSVQIFNKTVNSPPVCKQFSGNSPSELTNIANVRLLCFVSHSNGMTSCQSSSTENVSCNVAPFFYHHTGDCGDTTSCVRQATPPVCKQFSGNSPSELTNIDGKACNNIPKAVNKLDLSALWLFFYKYGGLSCFIEYLHRKLLLLPILSLIILRVHLLDLHIKTIQFLFLYLHVFDIFNSIQNSLSVLGHDISPRTYMLKGWYMNEGC
jgi:hypothetical protein